jgi:hypothetical protein
LEESAAPSVGPRSSIDGRKTSTSEAVIKLAPRIRALAVEKSGDFGGEAGVALTSSSPGGVSRLISEL